MPDQKGAVAYQVGLLVLPGATELDLTLHLELFRVANGLLNTNLFCVDILTVDNQNVALANGRVIAPTTALNPCREFALTVVLSHINPAPALIPAIHVAIRKLAKASALVAAADQAPLLLASAGMLDGRVATCHVDLMLAARESYPAVEFVDRLWVREGNVLTYPGHLSTVDTMIEYVGGVLGSEFAEALSTELISAAPRPQRSSQRSTRNSSEGINDRRVLHAIEIMRCNIEAPLSIPDIAKRVGVSPRSLEVFWRNELGSSPQLFYMRERVNHSCSLLLFSGLSITEISCICGFSSGASFSRAFSDLTGISPSEYRRRHGNKIAPAVLLQERAHERVMRRTQSMPAVNKNAGKRDPRSALKATRVS
jgi:AraC family carnitine catabolism transcriptional activator